MAHLQYINHVPQRLVPSLVAPQRRTAGGRSTFSILSTPRFFVAALQVSRVKKPQMAMKNHEKWMEHGHQRPWK
jgi:uncharacterized membrane-anchored protein